MAVGGGLGPARRRARRRRRRAVLKNLLQDMLPLLGPRAAQFQSVVFAMLFILLLQYARGGLMGFVQRWTQAPSPARGRHGDARRRRAVAAPRAAGAGRADRSRSRGAVKRFGGLVAVDDVSFEVRAGEIVGLIGPNGAGKSTMFNLLTGALPMSAGRIEFLGRDVSARSQRRLARLGMARTFQHVKLRPEHERCSTTSPSARTARTRAGMLRSALRLDRARGAPHCSPRRCASSQRIGLAERAHEPAGNLPLGQQRLLEIARALAADPALLLLDEPAAGLRRQEKQALAELLQRLRGEGVTILLVEHDMDFVMRLVDRIVVMDFGAKLVEGAPAAVRADPRVQAAYLGMASADERRLLLEDRRPARRLRPRRGAARRLARARARPDRHRDRPERRRQDDAAGRRDGPAAVARHAALRRRATSLRSTSRRASSAASAWCPRSASCSAT